MAIITLPPAVRIKSVEWTVDQPAQVILRRGMKIGTYDQAVFVMADTAFASDGSATVTFKPSLRLSPADGSYVEIVHPTVLMSLSGSQVGWSVDPGQIYQIKQLQLEEAF